MPVSASIAMPVRRQAPHEIVVSWLWHALRADWQRRQERAIARCVHEQDHEGVSADYRMARRGR